MRRGHKDMYAATGPHGIMFHHFHDGTHPVSQGSISGDQFAQVIDHCGVERFLCAHDWFQKAIAGRLEDGDLCITFDDGLMCQFDVALPVLDHYRLTAFWFVYTSVHCGAVEMIEIYRTFRHQCFSDIDDFYRHFFDALGTTPYEEAVRSSLRMFDSERYLDDCPFYSAEDKRFRFVRDVILDPAAYRDVMMRMMKDAGFDPGDWASRLWMSDDDLRHLHARGHTVGLHSHTHPTAIERLPVAEQETEYRTNRDVLLSILGESPATVAHPCNSYTADSLEILRRLGVKLGFRGTMAIPVAPSELEFPREDHANILKGL